MTRSLVQTRDALGPEARRRRRRHRLRWLGAAALIALLAAVTQRGLMLYAGVVVGATALVGWLVARALAFGVKVERELTETEVAAGGVVGVTIRLAARSLPLPWVWWQDSVDEGLEVPDASCGFAPLAPGRPVEGYYEIRPPRRGLFRLGPTVLETSGPFGLVRRFQLGGDARFVTVHSDPVALLSDWPPSRRPAHEIPARRSLFEDPTRFAGIRPYQRGDSVRRIHWRATARSGRLQSCVYEQTVLQGVHLAVDMCSGSCPGYADADPATGDPSVELVVRAAASLAEHVLAGGQRVGLISNGADAAERYPEDWSEETFRRIDDVMHAGRALRKLLHLRPLVVDPGRGRHQQALLRTALARLIVHDGLTMAELLSAEHTRLPMSEVLTVITASPDPALAEALHSLRRAGYDVAVVVARPGDRGQPEIPAEFERLTVRTVADAVDLAQLGAAAL